MNVYFFSPFWDGRKIVQCALTSGTRLNGYLFHPVIVDFVESHVCTLFVQLTDLMDALSLFGTGTGHRLHCAYTVLTLCSHCAYTVLTLCLHCAYTALILCLHCAYTVLTLYLHCAYTVLTLCLPVRQRRNRVGHWRCVCACHRPFLWNFLRLRRAQTCEGDPRTPRRPRRSTGPPALAALHSEKLPFL